MEQSDYVVWDTKVVKNACILTGLEGIERTYRIDDGEPLLDEVEGARIHMDPDHPNDTLLTDVLINPYSMVIASERVVEILRSRDVKKAEFLPITIVDHKGHDVAEKYYIVHPIEHVGCLDVEASDAEWDMVDESAIESVSQIVLDAEKVDPLREIFRPKPFLEVVLISRNLADALDEGGVQGCQWIELSEYSEF